MFEVSLAVIGVKCFPVAFIYSFIFSFPVVVFRALVVVVINVLC